MDGRDVAGSAPRLTGPLSWLARGATAMTDEWDSISSHKGYVTVAADEHGRPVLLEIRMSKSGGLLRGLMDCLAASVSLGLQRGVPSRGPRGRSCQDPRPPLRPFLSPLSLFLPPPFWLPRLFLRARLFPFRLHRRQLPRPLLFRSPLRFQFPSPLQFR